MQLCIYCQTNPGGTADHVPPKGLSPKPRPSNQLPFRPATNVTRASRTMMNAFWTSLWNGPHQCRAMAGKLPTTDFVR